MHPVIRLDLAPATGREELALLATPVTERGCYTIIGVSRRHTFMVITEASLYEPMVLPSAHDAACVMSRIAACLRASRVPPALLVSRKNGSSIVALPVDTMIMTIVDPRASTLTPLRYDVQADAKVVLDALVAEWGISVNNRTEASDAPNPSSPDDVRGHKTCPCEASRCADGNGTMRKTIDKETN